MCVWGGGGAGRGVPGGLVNTWGDVTENPVGLDVSLTMST